MTTEQLDELFQLAHETVGINSALDWVRDVDHLDYQDAAYEIRRRMAAIREGRKP